MTERTPNGPATHVPQRIQLRRTKGWRKPDGAIVVARPSKWGNPFRVGGVAIRLAPGIHLPTQALWRYPSARLVQPPTEAVHVVDRATAVSMYRGWIERRHVLDDEGVSRPYIEVAAEVLAGHDLACWCPLDQPCHADVLLELANRSTP